MEPDHTPSSAQVGRSPTRRRHEDGPTHGCCPATDRRGAARPRAGTDVPSRSTDMPSRSADRLRGPDSPTGRPRHRPATAPTASQGPHGHLVERLQQPGSSGPRPTGSTSPGSSSSSTNAMSSVRATSDQPGPSARKVRASPDAKDDRTRPSGGGESTYARASASTRRMPWCPLAPPAATGSAAPPPCPAEASPGSATSTLPAPSGPCSGTANSASSICSRHSAH